MARSAPLLENWRDVVVVGNLIFGARDRSDAREDQAGDTNKKTRIEARSASKGSVPNTLACAAGFDPTLKTLRRAFLHDQ
jgi:hypothetical protein